MFFTNKIMTTAIIQIITGLILILAVPYFLDSMIRKKSNRKGAKVLCKIFGYIFIIWGAYNVICTLIYTVI